MLHNLVLNPEFEGLWTGGDPADYSEQETNTTVRQLDKAHVENHPWRVRTVNGPGDDYVLNGRWAYRADIAAAGVADGWRLWPRLNPLTGPEVDVTLITTFRIIAGTNDNFAWTENAIVYATTVAAGYYTPVSFAVALVAAMAAAGPSANTYTWTWNGLTRTWTVARAAGADAFGFQWTDPTSTMAALLGFTADDTAAVTYTSDGPSPAGMPFYRSEPNMRWALKITARNSVAGNLLRLRVVGLSTDFVTPYYLDQDPTTLPGRWTETASFLSFRMVPGWSEFGVSFQTFDQRFFCWQISNGTAGAQLLDVGRCELWSPVDMLQEGQT